MSLFWIWTNFFRAVQYSTDVEYSTEKKYAHFGSVFEKSQKWSLGWREDVLRPYDKIESCRE